MAILNINLFAISKMNKLPEQVIVDILQTQMELAVDQVWIRDQNTLIPGDNRLYVIVGMVDSQFISTTNTPVVTYDGMSEILQTVSRENIQIDILSRSTDAVYRRWEVLTALLSQYSQQQQEDQQFRIFTMPRSFVNSSNAEGGSNINRFSIVIACHAWYTQEKVLQSPDDYYNDFKTRVDDAATIGQTNGLIEFEIKET